METIVKTTESGKILKVEDFFNNNGKGAYDGVVVLPNGQKVRGGWFFNTNERKVSFSSYDFNIDGEKYRFSADVISMSDKLKERLESRIMQEAKRKEEQKSYRESQMFGY